MATVSVNDQELLAKLFSGFADPSRLAILEALRAGPMSVTEIVGETGLTQSNASNHLACLRNCGHVSAEQAGRRVIYQISGRRVLKLMDLAAEMLAANSQGVRCCPRM